MKKTKFTPQKFSCLLRKLTIDYVAISIFNLVVLGNTFCRSYLLVNSKKRITDIDIDLVRSFYNRIIKQFRITLWYY